MTDAAYFWFRLFRTKGIGPKSLVAVQREMDREGIGPEAIPLNKRALDANYPGLAKILLGKITADDRDAVRQEYESLEEQDISIIHPGHPHYPPMLMADAERFGFSPILFSKGQPRLLSSPGVAIIGSRNVSAIGAGAARLIARDLAGSGFNVVSGYAKGVDTEAHLGALEAEGTTTMVLSYGILEFKPKRDLDAFRFDQDIMAVSQFAPRERWKARNAMARNKLVCALSRAVVVIESGPAKDSEGKMSGTFDAAKSALEMGRPLFVLSPDTFTSPPLGNGELIALGGISIDPRCGAKDMAARMVGLDDQSVYLPVGSGQLRQGDLFASAGRAMPDA
jgi:DNA processing protein